MSDLAVLTDPPRAWITYVRKDGDGRHSGTISTNPDYVKAHKDWVWLPIAIPPAPAENSLIEKYDARRNQDGEGQVWFKMECVDWDAFRALSTPEPDPATFKDRFIDAMIESGAFVPAPPATSSASNPQISAEIVSNTQVTDENSKDMNDLETIARALYEACKMEIHNADIFKGKWQKGAKAWDGEFVLQQMRDAVAKYEMLRNGKGDGIAVLGRNFRDLEGSEMVKSSMSELMEALGWILPMAKGYAAEHPVGNNAEIVAHAERIRFSLRALAERMAK